MWFTIQENYFYRLFDAWLSEMTCSDPRRGKIYLVYVHVFVLFKFPKEI